MVALIALADVVTASGSKYWPDDELNGTEKAKNQYRPARFGQLQNRS